jgi:Cu+-exporting ATPase
MEAADIVLMHKGLEAVGLALDVAHATYRRIQLNFAWAYGYNIVAVPLAAGALYPVLHAMVPPWVAGAAMAFSSVSVVASSLLLTLYKPPGWVRAARGEHERRGGVAAVVVQQQ